MPETPVATELVRVEAPRVPLVVQVGQRRLQHAIELGVIQSRRLLQVNSTGTGTATARKCL